MLYTHGHDVVSLADLRKNYKVPSVAELRAVRKSASGTRWKPVHHAVLVEQIHQSLAKRKLRVTKEEFILSEDSHDIFGYMHIDGVHVGDRNDITPALGFRSSNVQRFSLIGVSGGSVTICANGLILGDFVFGRKHTKGNMGELDVSIDDGLGTWTRQVGQMSRFIDFMEDIELSARDTDHLLVEAGRRGVLAWNQLGKIDKQYRAYEDAKDPHHVAFAGRNAWSLYNAVTEVGKLWSSPRIGERGLKGFPRVIADVYGFEELDALVEPDADPARN